MAAEDTFLPFLLLTGVAVLVLHLHDDVQLVQKKIQAASGRPSAASRLDDSPAWSLHAGQIRADSMVRVAAVSCNAARRIKVFPRLSLHVYTRANRSFPAIESPRI